MPRSVAVVPSEDRSPAGPTRKVDSEPLPALEAYTVFPAATSQQVAAWAVAAVSCAVNVPLRAIPKVATAFGPASVTARSPRASKSKPNGTVPGRSVSTGAPRPAGPGRKTRMLLPPFLVVTTSRLPSGVKPICPGVLVNSGVW